MLDHERLPVWVYGTLRPGNGNHRLVEPHLTKVCPAELPGHRLYCTGLPYIGPGKEHERVVGDLITLRPDTYDLALDALDVLEGVAHGLYQRQARWVRLRGEAERGEAAGQAYAWVYLGGSGFRYSKELIVPGGDWARFD